MKRHDIAMAIVRSGALGILGEGYGCDRALFALGVEFVSPKQFDDVIDEIAEEFELSESSKAALNTAISRVIDNESYADLIEALGR